MTVHPPPTRLGDMELPRFKPDAILRLKQSALYLARKTAPYAANLSTRPLLSDADGPFLPLPSPLAPQLTSLGVDEVSAHRISLSLTRAASKLKGLCEEEFKRRLATPSPHFNDCQAFARIPSALSAIYARAIREWTSYLLTNVAPRVLHIQSLRRHTAPSDPDNKVPFNHNATPALEAFFDENAFPSRLEKHELAVRWGMRYRQIDVWFQNRRRRFKKEGKDLKQRPSGNALLHDLEQVVVDTLLPLASEDEGVPSEQERNGQSFSDIPAFNLEVPAHAFPNPWPPTLTEEPAGWMRYPRRAYTDAIRHRRVIEGVIDMLLVLPGNQP
ncbi:hypothetical protein DICSQDRAFT_164697 [Dichomitus squalens LYAD-421 SS1]|uniref:uncharacterized protein n=1 Tax=Dichomitus squalens (strain LYAD-421) TaxID=732165 RepID=UPI0004413343|nr:uncharacterized protein DICSQDRAFT_164697 [Dichomitus squalens LYAD-421 SS1]EJF66855.1 hypothetical protein DICSQDRAFT_164697 [Dichomitus squalens LYAD-421 SS1]